MTENEARILLVKAVAGECRHLSDDQLTSRIRLVLTEAGLKPPGEQSQPIKWVEAAPSDEPPG